MSDPNQIQPRAKKSVALSGTVAGNTAICTVGRTGNDLHYRGYDILDFAETAEFEEVAYLLIHGQLPTQAELKTYKAKLRLIAQSAPGGQAGAGGDTCLGPSDGRDAHRLLDVGQLPAGKGDPPRRRGA